MAAEGHKLLSKNVLKMKFMNRTKDKVERLEELQKIAHLIEAEAVDLTSQHPKVMKVQSYADCEPLMFSRMSFKGFNEEIETLMAEKKREEMEKAAPSAEVTGLDISNREMVKRYQEMDITDHTKRKRYQRPVD